MDIFSRRYRYQRIRKDYIREHNIYSAEMTERLKNTKPVEIFDKNMWNNGIRWYCDGLALENASNRLRNNSSFVRGFNFAKRKDALLKEVENLGSEWYMSGNNLEDAPKKMVNNPSFIKGYNDAKNNVNRRRLEL